MNVKTKQMFRIGSGFIVLLFLGTVLAWSVFLEPVENTFGWSRSETSLAATVNTMAFSLGSILTGMLSKKVSFTNILRIAAIFLISGFMLAGMMKPGDSIIMLYLTYGLLIGTSCGMGYNAILSACPLWMSDKPATANGLLLMGYAFSTALFAPVITSLIEVTESVTSVFRILGIVCGLGILIFSCFVRIPNLRELDELPQRDRHANKKTHNVITFDMIKMPLFWVYYIITVLFPGVGLAIINHNAPILTELGASATFAALIVSVCAICNGSARFIFGFVFDKLGVSKSMIIISVVLVASIGVILLGYSSRSIPLYIAGACMMLAGFGFNATSMPSILRELFGHRTFSLNYSILGTDALLSAWFGTIVGIIQTSTGNYGLALIVLAAIIAVCVGFVLIFFGLYKKEMKKRESETVEA